LVVSAFNFDQRLFPERQVLVTSQGRVRHITLSRGLQMTVAAAVVATMALLLEGIAILGYGMASGAIVIDRTGAFHHATAAAASGDSNPDELDGLPSQSDVRIKAAEEARDAAVAQERLLQHQLDLARQAAASGPQNLSLLNKSLDTDRDHQLAEAQRAIRQLEGDLQTANAQSGQFRATLDDVQRKLKLLTAERDRTVAERNQLQAQIAELEAQGRGGVASAPRSSEETPHATADRPTGQRSDNIGEIEQLIASTGIDVEDLLARATLPPNQGGPYVALESPAAAGGERYDDSHRSEELQKIVATLPLAAPLTSYEVESGFGGRIDPFTRRQAFHPGLDLVAAYRSPVYSTAPGIVTFTGVKSAYGKLVEIDHGHGIVTRYAHLHRITVTRGQKVPVHFQVGELGSTGRSTGPHLHYEVAVDGAVQDPSKFLEAGKNVVQAISGN
jgi:murein DD-endopeptidase MepM/ murein hydrolase activator NlpD